MAAETETNHGGHGEHGGKRKSGLLRRLFQLWGVHARLDFIWVTRDLKLFLIWTLSDTIINISTVMGMLLLAERFAGIGAWSKFQVIFLLGYVTTVSGVLDTFFNFNVLYISRRLGRGQLDHSLIQPIPLWLGLATEGFCPLSGSASLVPGIGMMVWATHRLPLNVSPGWLAALVGSLFASCVVTLGFQFLWGSLAFWSPRSAEEVSSSSLRLLNQLKSYPLDGLSAALSGGLLSVLPVGFVGWLPCRALLGLDHSAWGLWRTPLAAAVFVALASWVFQKGLKYYGQTGSQRYSALGHRS